MEAEFMAAKEAAWLEKLAVDLTEAYMPKAYPNTALQKVLPEFAIPKSQIQYN